MNFTPSQSHKQLEELEGVIAKAIKKVHGTKENDLCKYIPMTSGGYMHHFTFRKLRNKNPEKLCSLIEKFIIQADRPIVIPPKARAARGSRKKKDIPSFSKLQLERMLNMARLAGDSEMIRLLSPKKSLPQCKRELIQSIRQGAVDYELWNNYTEAVNAQQSLVATGVEAMGEQ